MTNHYVEAEAWLARGEAAYEAFEADELPRDVGLLRKAEVAAAFAKAHGQLAMAFPGGNLPPMSFSEYPAPTGAPIPVSPASAPEPGERH